MDYCFIFGIMFQIMAMVQRGEKPPNIRVSPLLPVSAFGLTCFLGLLVIFPIMDLFSGHQ